MTPGRIKALQFIASLDAMIAARKDIDPRAHRERLIAAHRRRVEADGQLGRKQKSYVCRAATNNLGETFESAAEASERYRLDSNAIRVAIRRDIQAAGLTWWYADGKGVARKSAE